MNDVSLSQILDCTAKSWSAEIGDPTFMGWLTVAAYFLTAVACYRAMRARLRDKVFWAMLAIILALLCVNKQLDLQSALTAVGRCAAQLQGWYDNRRMVQTIFIAAIGLISVMIFFVSVVYLFHSLRRVGVALIGFGVLLTFVFMRAVGFHEFDVMIGYEILGARMNWILELSGIALILINAIVAVQRRPTRRILADGSSVPRGD